MTASSSMPPGPMRTGAEFDPVTALIAEAQAHPAVHHPWLAALATGNLPDPPCALRDFALAHYGYAQWWPLYAQAVARRLANPNHRALLEHDLGEDRGHLEPADRQSLLAHGIDPRLIEGEPQLQLFRDFCGAIGIGMREFVVTQPTAVVWREEFLLALQQGSPAFAVGALGLGTTSVMQSIYRQVLAGIRHVIVLPPRGSLFFELHCLLQDRRDSKLLAITRDLAQTPAGLEHLRAGMHTALGLRAQFFTHLHRRALRQGQSKSA